MNVFDKAYATILSEYYAAVRFGDEMYEKYVETKDKLKTAEDTLADIDFDIFGMESDYLKVRAEYEALKTENKRLQKHITALTDQMLENLYA